MKLNYLILAYHYPKHLKRIVSKLNTKESNFYIHIDKKNDIEIFKKELQNFNNVHFIKNRVKIIWGNFSIVRATLNLIEAALKDKSKGYCILMSGQDYPIKSNLEIINFFKTNYGYNFITSRPIEKIWQNYSDRIYKYNIYSGLRGDVYTINNIFQRGFFTKKNLKNLLLISTKLKQTKKLKLILKKRKHPQNIKLYGGSQWWALPIETLQLIIKFVKTNPNFLNYHKYTHIPDEIFFHTIVSNLIEEEKIKPSITYVNWSRKNTTLPVTFKTKEDLTELINSNCLFARKFEEESDILDEIDLITNNYTKKI